MHHEIVKRKAQQLGLKGGDLAALANISAPKLSNFFRGRASLDEAKLRELGELLNDLESMKTCFPIPIGTHDAKLLALAIERFREGRFNAFRDVMGASDWTPSSEEMSQTRRHFHKVFRD